MYSIANNAERLMSLQVWNHEEADKLFCEEIDVGEEGGPREIASGLREHYSLDDMQDRKVLVVCNLKPAKIVGFTSNGMVLAAKVRVLVWHAMCRLAFPSAWPYLNLH